MSSITEESYPLNAEFRTLELAGVVWNYSDMPIFNLVVAIPEVGTGQQGFRIVKPGESVRTRLVLHLPEGGGPVDVLRPRRLGLSLHFLDGRGRHWHRRGAAQPTRVLRDALSENVPLESFRDTASPDAQGP
ncbi:hypothetical protein [Amycolatopsis sp. NPDC021455]|uniref:hypothetical protein n=1 Tax=Amycolatopsis sp. NPDC021455 TaxID=3154901 RepID=UPI003406864B